MPAWSGPRPSPPGQHRLSRLRDARRLRCRLTGICLFIGLLAPTACTPTARTRGTYEAKAVKAAQAVDSALNSDLLLIEAVSRGHTTAAYVSVASSQAEDSASGAASTFRSIQPPDHRSEVLRPDLGDLREQAENSLADTRIAGRRGDDDTPVSTRPELEQVAQNPRALGDH